MEAFILGKPRENQDMPEEPRGTACRRKPRKNRGAPMKMLRKERGSFEFVKEAGVFV